MNKVAVITGGTKGIGRAIIYKFVEHGFDIITCSRNNDELRVLKNDLESTFQEINVLTMNSDLSEKTEVTDFIKFMALLIKYSLLYLKKNIYYYAMSKM
jgi:short-subunit dehydrogenase